MIHLIAIGRIAVYFTACTLVDSDVDANFQFNWNTVGLGKTLMTIAIIVAMHRHNRNDVSLFFLIATRVPPTRTILQM